MIKTVDTQVRLAILILALSVTLVYVATVSTLTFVGWQFWLSLPLGFAGVMALIPGLRLLGRSQARSDALVVSGFRQLDQPDLEIDPDNARWKSAAGLLRQALDLESTNCFAVGVLQDMHTGTWLQASKTLDVRCQSHLPERFRDLWDAKIPGFDWYEWGPIKSPARPDTLVRRIRRFLVADLAGLVYRRLELEDPPPSKQERRRREESLLELASILQEVEVTDG